MAMWSYQVVITLLAGPMLLQRMVDQGGGIVGASGDGEKQEQAQMLHWRLWRLPADYQILVDTNSMGASY